MIVNATQIMEQEVAGHWGTSNVNWQTSNGYVSRVLEPSTLTISGILVFLFPMLTCCGIFFLIYIKLKTASHLKKSASDDGLAQLN